MNDHSETWALIVNPKSGRKDFRPLIRFLFSSLREAGIQYEYKLTRFAGHAINIAAHYTRLNYRNFIVVGGDGTISEVVYGILSANIPDHSNVKLAIIPRGAGNDWGRFWGLTRNYKQSIDVLLNRKAKLIDIGKVTYYLEDEIRTHYFINSIGFGLDATVVKVAHSLRRYLGSHSFLYLLALVGAVFSYRSSKANIILKDKNLNKMMFTMNIANGCYSGGGMKQNPDAVPDDGLFDVMLAETPTFKDILKALTMLFNGTILKHPVIESFQTNKFELNIDNNSYFEADGILVHANSKFDIELIPECFQMIIP